MFGVFENMKKKLILLIVTSCFAAMLLAMPPLTVVSSQSQSLSVRFTAPQLELETEKVLDEDFHVIKMANSAEEPEPGYPNLPVFSGSVILPPTGSYSLQVNPISNKTIPNIKPIPVFTNSESKALAQYDILKYETPQTKDLVSNSNIVVFRDFRILQFNVNPLQWNPQTQALTVYDEIDIKISFTTEPEIQELPPYSNYSPAFRRLYDANLLNFVDYRNLNDENNYGKILLIYPQNVNTAYTMLLNSFVTWKLQKGHEVEAVSTQTTGTSNSAIKNYIQSKYDNPLTRPDYIILVGDTSQIPTFIENMSSYGGEGDYPYTHLAGNDLLGDVMIGRISAETADQLGTILAKVFSYEKNINNDPSAAEWLNRILLIGDPTYSGVSCEYNSKYIKELAELSNPEYSFVENYNSGFSTTINSAINQGVNFFSYRGWLNMSGWDPSSSLNNGQKLPHAVILTCGTGDFHNSTATTESFIRLGTSANPSGAVTAIGMATTGTHTMFNNTLNAAIFNGIFSHDMRSMGEALLNGRHYIREVYGATHSNQANYFAHWCNLMGDPTMEVFVGIPSSMQINAPTSITLGTNILDAYVADVNGRPISNASVTAYSVSQNQILARGFSDETGNVSLFIPNGITATLVLTAAKNDHKPAQLYVEPGAGGLVFAEKQIVEDGSHGSSGNSDSFANATERIALLVSVKNTSDILLSALNGDVSSDDPFINLITESISFPDLDINNTTSAENYILFDVLPNIPPYHDIRLSLNISDGSGMQHQFPVHVPAYNARLEVENINISAGDDNTLDPFETGSLTLGIRNDSIAGVDNIYAQLFSLNDLVLVEEDTSYIGQIYPSAIANTLEGFSIFARSIVVPGMQIPFRLRLSNDNGFLQDAFFNITIGTVSPNTPLGPDDYGYFIYDMNDIQYDDCPDYEWIEINPTVGGVGTRLNTLSDSGTSGDEGDQVGSVTLEVVNLPFEFTFYGIPYQQITVSTNGFIALGITEDSEFRNSRLPGGMGPSPMIAAFWDDLILSGDSGIYKYYDNQNKFFVIEYYNMRNGYNRTSLETFQVILYDPLFHPTSYGDGKIKIQYKDFNNVDVGGSSYTPTHGNYATIGIKDHTNKRGLEYTYNNQYNPGASPLTNNSALIITTVPVLHESPYLVLQDLFVTGPDNDIAQPGEIVELGIQLVNQGLSTATETSITASLNHPFAQLVNNSSNYPDIVSDSGAINLVPITVAISEDCPEGSIIELMLRISNGDSEWNYPAWFTVKRPSVTISSYMMNDASGNGNGLVEPGESLDLVLNFGNITDLDAHNLSVSIMSVSPHANFGISSAVIDHIPAHSTVQIVFPLSLSPETPLGNNITCYVSTVGDLLPVSTTQLVISVGTTGMSEGFEQHNGYFEPSPSYNGWEWGESAYAGAHEGNKVWGTRLNSNYALGANYKLTTQPVYIGANFMLEFWHKYDIGSTNAGGNVQISTNGGSVWQVISPEGGYTSSSISALSAPGFTGTSEEWSLVRIPLASFGNRTVQFRFNFAAPNYGSTADGWFIDDVRTTGYLAYAARIEGTVESSDPSIEYSSIFVHNADMICSTPDSEGNYRLFLPMLEQEITVSGAGYTIAQPVVLHPSIENSIILQDFFLYYLKPVTGIGHSIQTGTLTVSWNPPQNPDFPVLSYEVFRKLGAAHFELVAEVDSPHYIETLTNAGEYQFYVIAKYALGNSISSSLIEFSWGGSDVLENNPVVPKTDLQGNYPNPFNPETTIVFNLAKATHAKLSVFNLKGQKVKDLLDEYMATGEYRKIWNGTDYRNQSVSSGMYLIRLSTSEGSFNHKVLLMK